MEMRGLEPIDSSRLTEALARTPAEHYVIWTGHSPGTRSGSMRSQALACIREIGEPVPLRVLMSRAARISGDLGFDPDAVRSAVRTYQMARPAVYILVRRLSSGEFVAVTDVPYPAGATARIACGDLVLGRGVRRFGLVDGTASPLDTSPACMRRPLNAGLGPRSATGAWEPGREPESVRRRA